MASRFSLEASLSLIDKFTKPLNKMGGAADSFSSQINKSFGRANTTLSQMQTRMKNASTEMAPMAMAGAGMVMAGQQISRAGHAILDSFGDVVNVGREFQGKMSEIGAVTGSSAADMEKLTASARELGATTSFSASQAAEAQLELAKAGLTTEQILSATPGLLDLAKASGMGLGESATIASDAMNQFGMSAEQMGIISDTMAVAANKSTIGIRDLGETFKYVGPIASAAGMDIQKTAALTALLGNAGIKASTAGTSLASIINALGNSGKKAQGELARLGIATTEVGEGGKKNLRDIPSILADMADKTKNMGEAEKISLVSKAFGNDASTMASMLKLMDMGSDKIRKMTADMYDSSGAAKLMGDKMSDNLNGALAEFDSASEEIKLISFDAIKDSLKSLVQFVTKVINAFGAWAREHPTLTKWILISVAVIGALLVGLGFLLTMAGTMAGAFVAMSMAAATFGFTLSAAIWPVTLIVLGIIALIAVIALLINYWDEMPGWIKPVLVALFPFIVIPFLIIKYWSEIMDFFKHFFAFLVKSFLAIYDWFVSMPAWAKFLLATIIPIIGIPLLIITYWSTLKEFFSGLMVSIVSGFATAGDWIKNIWFGIGSIISSSLAFINSGVDSAIQSLRGLAPDWLIAWWDWVAGHIASILDNIVSPMEALSGIMQLWDETTAKKEIEAKTPASAQGTASPAKQLIESVNRETVDINVSAPPGTTATRKGKKSPGISLNMGTNGACA